MYIYIYIYIYHSRSPLQRAAAPLRLLRTLRATPAFFDIIRSNNGSNNRRSKTNITSINIQIAIVTIIVVNCSACLCLGEGGTYCQSLC